MRLLASMLAAILAPAMAGAAQDLTRMSIEELLQVQVEGASRRAQPLAEAPSAVTVVDAEAIRRLGLRTLAEGLLMAPGTYAVSDRAYTYQGIRGFGRPGDYNSRLLLLVDGVRRNDPLYDQAMVGHESPIEMDWVKRLEFVPGPSSALYGGNALFGIANAVLWNGADLDGSQATVEVGSGRLARVGLLAGRQTAAGTDWVAGLSVYERAGADIHFPEFEIPGSRDGVARGLDGERYLKGFAKASRGPWSLAANYASRHKDVPTAYYGTDFGVAGNTVLDRQAHLDLGYAAPLGNDWNQVLKLIVGEYRYAGDYIYEGAINRDEARASWWGGDYRLSYTGLERHRLLMGVEFRRNRHLDQFNFDVDPRQDRLDDRRQGSSLGLFVQDEWRLGSRWLANLGLRADRMSGFTTAMSPRVALIHHPLPGASLKLIHGSAFRPANAYERFYTDNYEIQKPNPDLKTERIVTTELAGDMAVTPRLRLSGSLYHYRLNRLVDQVLDPADGLAVFRNQPPIRARGVEAGAEGILGGNWRLRGSVAFQRVRQPDGEAVNSPQRLGKLFLDGPLPGIGGSLGLTLLAVGPRLSASGQRLPGYVVGNLVARIGHLRHGGEWSLGLYNLSGRHHLDPSSTEHLQVALPQDGRQIRLRWEIGF